MSPEFPEYSAIISINIGITKVKSKYKPYYSTEGDAMSASVKTAISMQQGLFDDVNTLASELNISRSKLFVLAMEDFIKKNENKKMLSQISAAFADSPDDDEKENAKLMQRKQKQMLQRDPW